MNDVMIDLETLGTAEDAAVISIGACTFDIMTGEIGETFYERIDWESAMIGRSVTAGTIQWWMSQDPAALEEVTNTEGVKPFGDVLAAFKDWLEKGVPEIKERCVWGNGATFDIAIMTNAYDDTPPWRFSNVRDMRTIRAFEAVDEDNELPFEGTKHNALADAIWQAKYVGLAYGRLKNGLNT